MLATAKLLATLSLLWAIAALAFQVLLAWGGGRKDYSERRGNAAKGVLFYFTTAMLPTHKEAARHHPVKFSIGLFMHVGVIAALLDVILLIAAPSIAPTFLQVTRPIVALSLLSGIYLLVRRARSETLRAMTAPDDFIAIGATCLFLALAALCTSETTSQVVFLLYATALLAYAPLGKLRHAIFFFAARADYGRRLGYRGVFPPAERKE